VKNGGAKLLSVEVEGCEVTPCILVKGQEYQITVTAESDRITTALPYSVKARVLGVDLEILSGEACDFLVNDKCPTVVGKQFTFAKGLLVSDNLPDVRL